MEWSVDLNNSIAAKRREGGQNEKARTQQLQGKGSSGRRQAGRPVVSVPVVESGSRQQLEATFLLLHHRHHHGSTVHGTTTLPIQLPLRCGAHFPPTTTLLHKPNPTPSLLFLSPSSHAPCCSCRLAAAADPSPSLTTSRNCRLLLFLSPPLLPAGGSGKRKMASWE